MEEILFRQQGGYLEYVSIVVGLNISRSTSKSISQIHPVRSQSTSKNNVVDIHILTCWTLKPLARYLNPITIVIDPSILTWIGGSSLKVQTKANKGLTNRTYYDISSYPIRRCLKSVKIRRALSAEHCFILLPRKRSQSIWVSEAIKGKRGCFPSRAYAANMAWV